MRLNRAKQTQIITECKEDDAGNDDNSGALCGNALGTLRESRDEARAARRNAIVTSATLFVPQRIEWRARDERLQRGREEKHAVLDNCLPVRLILLQRRLRATIVAAGRREVKVEGAGQHVCARPRGRVVHEMPNRQRALGRA